eukprot:5115031-Pyramimonas_sp.AAC.1
MRCLDELIANIDRSLPIQLQLARTKVPMHGQAEQAAGPAPRRGRLRGEDPHGHPDGHQGR